MDKVVRFCKTDPNEVILQNARGTHLAYMHKKIAIALADEINEKYCDSGESGQFDTLVMPDWILTKDRLPEREGQYLVCDTSGSVLSAYFEGTKFTKGEAGGFWVVAVTGWLPLPKPLRA